MSRRGTTRPGRLAAGLAMMSLAAAGGTAAPAATPGAPTVFDVTVMGAPVLTNVSLTAALPLLVTSGIGVSRSQLNSQPLIISEAAPIYSPLAEDAGLLGVPPLPAYPWCYSYYPGSPSQSSCGGQVPNVGGLAVQAASGKTSSSGSQTDPSQLQTAASTAIEGASAEMGSSPQLTVGHAESSTSAAPTSQDISAGASTALSDIEVAGVLHIGSIASSVSGSLSGQPGGARQSAKMAVTGATVAGQAVTIDTSGVHALGQAPLGGSVASAQSQVNQALSASGLSVTLLPAQSTQSSPDGTALNLSSGAVSVSFTNGSLGVEQQVLLGQSTLSLHASVPVSTSASYGAGGSTVAPPTSGSLAGAGTSAGTAATGTMGAAARPALGGASPSVAVAAPSAGSGGAPAPPVPGAGAGIPQKVPFYRTSLAALRGNWRHIYLVMFLLAVGMPVALLGTRVTLRRQSWKTIS